MVISSIFVNTFMSPQNLYKKLTATSLPNSIVLPSATTAQNEPANVVASPTTLKKPEAAANENADSDSSIMSGILSSYFNRRCTTRGITELGISSTESHVYRSISVELIANIERDGHFELKVGAT
jgi:hypothetical protein